jgi:type IV secretion/conjugal transfer VirB4 family ATPase
MSKSKPVKSGISYSLTSQDFIPIACHYDAATLLTKNGELIQTIQIHGTFSQTIGDNLTYLREIIRGTIQKNATSDNFAFWIHTVRRKTNLDDPSPYPDQLSSIIHRMWRDKNFWHDKFVNTLYISIVHSRLDLKISTPQAFLQSIFTAKIENQHDEFLQATATKLHAMVDSILADLNSFGAKKLQLKESDGMYYSEPLSLYSRIMNLNEHRVLLPIKDLAEALSTNRYAVGNNQIEVVDGGQKKFAAILSIKEYHEMPEEALDRLLRLSVEFITTEIFYFITKKLATTDVSYFDYILGVSKEQSIRECTDIASMMDSPETVSNKFCNQQISITLIGGSLAHLSSDLEKASKELSALGIVHVQEDINLEQTFWAQLPGNFTFLRRTSPNIVDNIAAFASLHNFPTGNSTNPWGKAITLLRTKQGTPHFINFHNESGIGHTVIFGPNQSGKTVMMNFLLSEAMKFRPTMLYILCGDKAKIFVNAIGGIWVEPGTDLSSFAPESVIAFDVTNADKETRYKVLTESIKYLAHMSTNEPKILAVDNIDQIFDDARFDDSITADLESLRANNAIIVGSINLNQYSTLYTLPRFRHISANLGCQIILPGDQKGIDIKSCTGIIEAEELALKSFAPLSRLCILKQDGRSVALELSLGGKPGALRMLSCSDKDLKLYEQVKEKNSEDWVLNLYETFTN